MEKKSDIEENGIPIEIPESDIEKGVNEEGNPINSEVEDEKVDAKEFINKDHSDQNMVVAIRVRPLDPRETSMDNYEIVTIEKKLLIVLDPKELECETEGKKLEVLHRSKEQKFFFDRIFPQDSSQEKQTAKGLISSIQKGYNATVFAYGTTGSGKTYTMVGTHDKPGVMVLTIQDMFASIKEDIHNDYEIKCSFVEIYNEIIRDLLVPRSKDTYLELRDDPVKGITIAGVTEVCVENTRQVMNLLVQGNRRRTTESTNVNQTSSRSHAVLQIYQSVKDKAKSTEQELLCGKLSLIDLAGSERGTVTENRGLRLREGAKINTSLLALANCINALGDKTKKGFYVNYRDSKLTRMLKDSLGGNCRTVMIATISPASSQYEETVNTLKYSNRAKNIKTKSIPNKKMVSIHISAYKNIINDLRDEIERLRHMVSTNTNVVNPKQLERLNAPAEPKPKPKIECPICTTRNDELLIKIKYANQIAQVYDDIMQLEQALIELDEQNTLNAIEIKRREAKIQIFSNHILEGDEEIDMLNAKPGDTEEVKFSKEQLKRQNEKVEILKENTKRNIERRQGMKKDLLESYQLIRKIRSEIPEHISTADIKEFLDLIIKNNFLESQNVQLLLNLQLQSRTIADLKMMILRQQKFISVNNLDRTDNFKMMLAEKTSYPSEDDPNALGLNEMILSPELVEATAMNFNQEGREKGEGLNSDNYEDEDFQEEKENKKYGFPYHPPPQTEEHKIGINRGPPDISKMSIQGSAMKGAGAISHIDIRGGAKPPEIFGEFAKKGANKPYKKPLGAAHPGPANLKKEPNDAKNMNLAIMGKNISAKKVTKK